MAYYRYLLLDLSDKTDAELLECLDTIPISVTILVLININLNSKTSINVVEIFKSIPSHINMVSLRTNNLGEHGAELAEIFSAIPPKVTSLDLADTNLLAASPESLIQAFSSLPENVISLNLSNNIFPKNKNIEVNELAKIINSIPVSVTSLNLSGSNFLLRRTATAIEMATILHAIPSGVTSLNFCSCDLTFRSPADLIEIIRLIPARIISLNLTGLFYEFRPATVTELINIFDAMPPGLSSLSLCGNNLGKISGSELVEIFRALPANLTVLDLSHNYLSHLSTAELIEIFRVLPVGITAINLHSTNFGEGKTSSEIVEILNSLPRNVDLFCLSGDDFSGWIESRPIEELITIIRAITVKLSSLDLKGMQFLEDRNKEELSEFFYALENSMKFLLVEDTMFEKLPEILKVDFKFPFIFKLYFAMINRDISIFKEELDEYSHAQEVCIAELITLYFNWPHKNKNEFENIFENIGPIPTSVAIELVSKLSDLDWFNEKDKKLLFKVILQADLSDAELRHFLGRMITNTLVGEEPSEEELRKMAQEYLSSSSTSENIYPSFFGKTEEDLSSASIQQNTKK